MAVVNDTVGTMMTCGFDDQRCEVGIIIGKDHINSLSLDYISSFRLGFDSANLDLPKAFSPCISLS